MITKYRGVMQQVEDKQSEWASLNCILRQDLNKERESVLGIFGMKERRWRLRSL